MLEPFHTIINEVLLKCKLNGEIVRIPSLKYRELKNQNTKIECLNAPKGEVPVYDTLTNKKIRISKDEFYSNKDRYIALSSRKMGDLNKN